MINTTDSINIITWNCNGFLSKSRQYELSDFVHNNDIHIVLLQETHVSNLSVGKRIEDFLKCKAIWNFGTFNSRGTAVLFFIDVNLQEFYLDREGRAMFVDFKYMDCEYRIINVYAPNIDEERKLFFDDIVRHFSCRRPVIFAGDFNCIEKNYIDKIGGNPKRGLTGSLFLKKLMS
ncbi:Exodeoxyribonuclease [invertebrate metagenome]|uniref:Exodeoxyribonuclease n=1 Tax=invertebrate metagenome TaxID=1711999 RepID=A0A2H9T3B8_9ZZZZ